MTIIVNGQERTVSAGVTIGTLIAELGIAREGVAVARNDEVVPRSVLDATPIAAGDRLEIIVAVAGG